MSLFIWVVLGVVAGFISNKLINKNGDHAIFNVILGMVGAVMAGFIYMKADVLGIGMQDVYNMVVAILGALTMLFAYHRVLKH